VAAHSSLANHWKLHELQRILDIDKTTAIGHLVQFWWAVSEGSQVSWDGILVNRKTDLAIARTASWHGDPGKFVDGLVRAEFLSREPNGPGIAVHRYERWAPQYVKSKWRAAGWQNPWGDGGRLVPGRHPAEPWGNPRGTPASTQGNPRVTSGNHELTLTNETKRNERFKTTSAKTAGGSKPKASPRKPRAARARNPVWDAVAVEFFGGEPKGSDVKRCGKIVRDLKKRDATPDQIPTVAAAFRSTWPTMDCTPEAVEKHWAKFVAMKPSDDSYNDQLKRTGDREHAERMAYEQKVREERAEKGQAT